MQNDWSLVSFVSVAYCTLTPSPTLVLLFCIIKSFCFDQLSALGSYFLLNFTDMAGGQLARTSVLTDLDSERVINILSGSEAVFCLFVCFNLSCSPLSLKQLKQVEILVTSSHAWTKSWKVLDNEHVLWFEGPSAHKNTVVMLVKKQPCVCDTCYCWTSV